MPTAASNLDQNRLDFMIALRAIDTASERFISGTET